MNRNKGNVLVTILICLFTGSFGQEVIIPLSDNQVAKDYYLKNSGIKKSASDITLELPVIDDFSDYLVEPDPDIWSDNQAFVNRSYSVDPVTIGVATLDAIDFDGSMYPHAKITPNTFIADHLTSHPINLSYPSSDSIYLSFYFQPEGRGEIPEPGDSLSVQFYDMQDSLWNTVWQIPGDTLHPFKLVMIPITEPKYLQNGFRFRFKNLASLSRSNDYPDYRSNVDHWNIDYVRLDRFRSFSDTIQRDVAWVQTVPSILKGLEALPWSHFEAAYNTLLNPTLSIRYLNNDSITRNVTRGLSIKDLIYNETFTPVQPTAQDLPPFEDTVVKYSYIYPFDFDRGEEGLFKLTASLRTDLFDHKNNDTVTRIQVFKDFYAYDDGSAEFGYGLRGQGTTDSKVALKYKVYTPDQLTGVEVYFNQIYDSLNLDYYFKFVVWDDNEGQPGSVIYQDEKSYTPVYSDSLNGMKRFQFSEPFPMVDGLIYVGWTQVNEYLLNIGLDVNSKPAGQALYYNIGDGWKASNAPGIIMLRPIFKTIFTQTQEIKQESLLIYPNPAQELVHIRISGSIADNARIEIYDLGGRQVMDQPLQGTELNISELQEGLYIIRLRTLSGIFTSKLLISR